MGVISQTIDSLTGGVSQQPQHLRYPNQATTLNNIVITDTGEVHQRAVMEKVSQAAPGTRYFNFTYNDSTTHATRVMLGMVSKDGTVTVSLVEVAAGTQAIAERCTMHADTMEYLAGSGKISAVQIGDTVFLSAADKVIQPTKRSTQPPTRSGYHQEGWVHVKTGLWSMCYKARIFATVNGTLFSWTAAHTVPASGALSELDPTVISNRLCDNLRTAIQKDVNDKKLPDQTVLVIPCGNYFRVYITDSKAQISKVQAASGYNEATLLFGAGTQQIVSLYHSTPSFSDLPANPLTLGGQLLIRIGSGSTDNSDYWVVSHGDLPEWIETAGIDEDGLSAHQTFTNTPVQLKKNDNGDWSVSPFTLKERRAGTSKSNPLPSFSGKAITDLLYWRNRLVFVTDESVTMSRANDLNNFWLASARTILDTDTIDVNAPTAGTRINITHAVPYNADLLLFSAREQFLLTADGAVTPRSVRIDSMANYSFNPLFRPVVVGQKVYFAAGYASSYIKCTELAVYQDVNRVKITEDITANVPQYVPIPYDVGQDLAICQGNNTLFFTGKYGIYCYKYLFMDNKKVIAGWYKWTINSGVVYTYSFTSNTALYVVVVEKNKGGLQSLYRIPFEPVAYILDNRIESGEIVYDEKTNTTVIPVVPDRHVKPRIFVNGTVYTPVDDKVVLHGKPTIYSVYQGDACEWTIQLSQMFLRNTETGRAETGGKLQLKRMSIGVNGTVFPFTVNVTAGAGQQQYSYKYTGVPLGEKKVGQRQPTDQPFRVPLLSDAKHTTIELQGEYPFELGSIMWEGNYNKKSRSV